MMNHSGFQSAMKGVSRILAGRYGWWLGVLTLVLPLTASASTNSLTWDREKGLVSADVRDWDLISLMESVAPAPSRHQSSGEFVDDDDLVILHHVLLVTVKQRVCAQRSIQMMYQVDVARIIEAAAVRQQAGFGKQRLGTFVTGFRE